MSVTPALANDQSSQPDAPADAAPGSNAASAPDVPLELAPDSAVTVVNEEPVKAAEDIRDAVSSQSETAGDVVDTLDSLAINIGAFHISIWDVLIVILVIAGVLAFAYFGSRLAHKLVGRVTRLDEGQKLLVDKIVSLAVWVMAFLVGVDILGINLTALAVFSGAFGLAIGFGLQKTFGNLIAGIILLMDKSIKPGDVIAIADQAGNETFGQIRKIGIRAVSMTTRDQREYLIPNENLMVNQVENWSYSSKNVRMQVRVGVSYLADLNKAEELMLEAARSCKRVLDLPPPSIWLEEYGDSSVNFAIHCWIKDPEEGTGNVRSEVLKKLWWLLKENDIEIPFPQRDLNLRDNEAFRDLIEALRDSAVKEKTAEE